MIKELYLERNSMRTQQKDIFVDHVEHSVGIRRACFRRLTHISMVIVPYLYYGHGGNCFRNNIDNLSAREFVSAFVFSY